MKYLSQYYSSGPFNKHFLSSSYKSGPISALKELTLHCWSLTHKQQRTTTTSCTGCQESMKREGEAQGSKQKGPAELGHIPSHLADLPNFTHYFQAGHMHICIKCINYDLLDKIF